MALRRRGRLSRDDGVVVDPKYFRHRASRRQRGGSLDNPRRLAYSGNMDRCRSPHLVTTFDVQRGAKPTLIHGDATPRAEVLADGPVKTMSKQPIGFRKALRRRHDGVISTASSRRLVALRLALTDVVRGIGDRASLLSRERRQMRREHLSRAAACTLSFHSYASRRGRRALVVGVAPALSQAPRK